MARLPYTGAESIAQPGTISIPDDYMHVQASPDAFGAGIAQAGQFLGQSMEKVGGELNQAAILDRNFERQADLTTAANTLQETHRNTIFGDPSNPNDTGYRGLQGKDALDKYSGTVKSLQDAREDLSATLSDPVTRQMFDRLSRRMENGALDQIAQHRQQQLQVYGVHSNAAATALSQQEAVRNFGNDEAFKNHLADTLRYQATADAAAGVPPDSPIFKENQAKRQSEIYAQGILSLSSTDALAAKRALDANADKLLPTEQTLLQNHIAPLVDKAQIQNAVGAVTGLGNAPRGTVSAPKNRDEFIQQWGPEAARIAPELGADPSVILAHWGQETGWGSHLHDNNVGNIQAGAGYQGRTVTRGDNDAKGLAYTTGFRAYDTPAQAADDYANLIKSSPRYQGAVGAGSDALKFGQGLKAGGYMANPNGPQDIASAAGSLKGVAIPSASAGRPVTTADGQSRTLDDMVSQVDGLTQGASVAVREGARSGVISFYHQQQSRLNIVRTGFNKEFGDTVAGLQDGRDVNPIPDDRIRQMYQTNPEQADALIEQQHVAQATGEMRKTIAFADPAAIRQMQQDLAAGTGAVSNFLAGRGRNAVAIGGDQSQDSSDNYRLRRQQMQLLDAAIEQRGKQIAADPALYAMQSPALAPFVVAAGKPSATPDDRAAAVSAVMAEQERLGVPEEKRRALPASQIAADIHALTTIDPSKGDMGMALSQKAALYGSAWHDVFGSYVRSGLSPEYQALAIMDRPDQTADRADFQRALSVQTERGGQAKLKEAVGKDQAKVIDDGIDDKMAEFKASVINDRDAVRMFDTYRDSVKTLAYYRAIKGDSNALQTAYDGVIGKRYDFDGSMRVPKGTLPDVKAATRSVLADLNPEALPVLGADDLAVLQGLPVPPSSTPNLAPDDARKQLFAALRSRGTWVPTADDGGLQLTVLGHDNTPITVTRGGQPVVVRFDALKPRPGPSALSNRADPTAGLGAP